MLLASCGGGADTTAPTVTLTATAPTAPGPLTLTADARDNRGVTRVEFYRGSTLIATDTQAPYTATVEVDQRDNGPVSFTARAYDAAGNVGQGGLNTTVNINTLYQGDWGWVAVNYDGTLLSGGSVTLFDQDAETYGAVALGVYATLDSVEDIDGPQTFQGLAALGPLTGARRLQLRFATDMQGSDLYLLADDDDDALEDLDGLPAFFDDDAEVYVTPTDTEPQIAAFLMVQLSEDPTLDDVFAESALGAQALPRQAALVRLATVAGKLDRAAKLNTLSGTRMPLPERFFPVLKHLGR
nr:Ig-like domain-containing protein [Deinococcus sp. HSC-46F16]